MKSLRASDRSQKGRTSQKGFSALTFRNLAGPPSIAWFARINGEWRLTLFAWRATVAHAPSGVWTLRGRREAWEACRLCSWIVSIAEAFGQHSVLDVSR